MQEESYKISGLLCMFGFLKEIRPSDPYINEFLLGPWRNLTSDQINQDFYPLATYSYLIQLIIVFLITDFLRYKPIIIISGISGIIVFSLFLWTKTLQWLQIMQLFSGLYMASEIAYFTYIYSKVSKEFYPKVTSHTRAALLIGKFVASVLAQTLINYNLMDYRELNYITLSAQIAATLWAFTLPNVESSLYFHRQNKSTDNDNVTKIKTLQDKSTDNDNVTKISAIKLLWLHFKIAYTNINVIMWSLWYSLALCGYLLVITYIQVLWKYIDKTPDVAWNGAVEAVLTLSGALFAILAGYIYSSRLFRIKYGSIIILSVLSVIQGCAILFATWPRNLYFSYVGYIIFGSLYAFSITISSTEVAKHLEEESFGLVFGINTLIGLILQTIIMLLTVSEFGFQFTNDMMKEWLKISLILCIFGFIREIRPSESFMSVFILGPWRNITSDELNRDIFPVGTYSYLVQSFLVFLITDYLRYKPLIILIGISGIIIWSLLIWSKTLLALQIMEFFYGTYMATEVAYYTYIYAKVNKEYYPKVTSHTRAAMLAGRLVASILSQLLITFNFMDYMELNYITLAAQIAATIWAFTLPNVQNSIYFHRKTFINYDYDNENNKKIELKSNGTESTAFNLLWLQFKNAYTNPKVIQWSLWYAIGIGGNLQFVCYMQVLWNEINKDDMTLWNGAVDAILTFLGTIFALLAGYFHAGRLNPRSSLSVLAGLTILQGMAIILTSWTTSLYISYVGYVLFGALYAFTITVTSAEIAKHLPDDSFGLVFGINTVIGLLIQTILTLIVVSDGGFALSVIDQYTVYGFYFIIIGICYFLFVVYESLKDMLV